MRKAKAIISASERFWAKVDKTETCWNWVAYKNPSGYGNFNKTSSRPSRSVLAHRFAWEITNGDIPTGMVLMHKCDNPACVNPDHLCVGTQAENIQDSVAKGRHRRNDTKYLPSGKNHHFYKVGMKITRDTAYEIRKAEGSHRKIGDRFHVSHSLVSLIKNNKIWI